MSWQAPSEVSRYYLTLCEVGVVPRVLYGEFTRTVYFIDHRETSLDEENISRTYSGLKLLALIVEVAHNRERRFCLELEEGVMQDLVVYIQLPHFWLHSLPLLGFELLVLLLHSRCEQSNWFTSLSK